MSEEKKEVKAWCPICKKNVVLNESKCPHCGIGNLKQILRG